MKELHLVGSGLQSNSEKYILCVAGLSNLVYMMILLGASILPGRRVIPIWRWRGRTLCPGGGPLCPRGGALWGGGGTLWAGNGTLWPESTALWFRICYLGLSAERPSVAGYFSSHDHSLYSYIAF